MRSLHSLSLWHQAKVCTSVSRDERYLEWGKLTGAGLGFSLDGWVRSLGVNEWVYNNCIY